MEHFPIVACLLIAAKTTFFKPMCNVYIITIAPKRSKVFVLKMQFQRIYRERERKKTTNKKN